MGGLPSFCRGAGLGSVVALCLPSDFLASLDETSDAAESSNPLF